MSKVALTSKTPSTGNAKKKKAPKKVSSKKASKKAVAKPLIKKKVAKKAVKKTVKKPSPQNQPETEFFSSATDTRQSPVEATEHSNKDILYIEGLRQNNLRNLTFEIEHNKITALVGPSGSGKSTLAFDTLFAEGRWRFMESLSTYSRMFLERMDRPKVDAIKNVRPAIAIEQKNTIRTSRSTVGTQTELNDYLRLLFARIGRLHCPKCEKIIKRSGPTEAARELAKNFNKEKALIGFVLNKSDLSVEDNLTKLVERGFIRIKVGDETFDLTEDIKEITEKISSGGSGNDEIFVITDRVVINNEDERRLTDSLETSFKEGEKEARVEIINGPTLNFSKELKCTDCNIEIEKPTPLLFSFNHPVGACPRCKGFGNLLNFEEDKIVPNKDLSIREGAIDPWTKPSYKVWGEKVINHGEDYKLDLDVPYKDLTKSELKTLYNGTVDFDGINDFFDHLETKKYKLHIRVFLSKYKGTEICPSCNGLRLKQDALSVRINDKNISDISAMNIKNCNDYFKSLELSDYEKEVAKEVLRQIRSKLDFLNDTGLGYITLDRPARTLSGGEAQRVTLASQLASVLTGVLYILDEPSIGLHPQDVEKLTKQIEKLSQGGNTVVVVEHDPYIINSSDNIIELGPGSGEMGGRIVYIGTREKFLKDNETLTAKYLTGTEKITIPRWKRSGTVSSITIKGCSGNNLKNVDLKIPLNTLTCMTGLSGSGKSTLAMDTLYKALAKHFSKTAIKPLSYKSITGIDNLEGVKLIDQSPIGRTPRSNPITYIGGFDEIRKFYSNLPQSKNLNLASGSFSFNVPGGRCEDCKGEGMEKIEMYFLPDIYSPCRSCNGKRYKNQILKVKYRKRNIYDILNTTFDDAAVIFADLKNLQKHISVIREIGLGYLKLGQPATTLSGGEAQRLKIAKELIEKKTSNILYIMDEPTTGLHSSDIKRLMAVLGKLVDSNNTVLMVEHNLDCIKTADYVIDIGPGGGDKGGEIICEGQPEEIMASKKSITGQYLKEYVEKLG